MTDQLSMEQRAAIANAANRTAAKIEGDVHTDTLSDPYEITMNQSRRVTAAGWRIFASEIMAPVSFSMGQFTVNEAVEREARPVETPRQFITAAVATFRDYEQQHLLKDPPATEKAEANARMADRGERILASWAASED